MQTPTQVRRPRAPSRSSVEEGHLISTDHVVGRDQSERLGAGLRDQHAVEWVSVKRRQEYRRFSMCTYNRQLGEASPLEFINEAVRKVEFSESTFDTKFPWSDRREEHGIGRRHFRATNRAEIIAIQKPPERDVTVEEEPHRPDDASKSARTSVSDPTRSLVTENRPFQAPGTRDGEESGHGTIRATGLPPRARMTVSPDSAIRMSSESRLLASCVLTMVVGMDLA